MSKVTQPVTPNNQRALYALTWSWIAGLVISGIAPYDRLTWFMEVAPCFIAWPILWCIRRRFCFTSLTLALLTIHGLILMLGGHYSYARVPLGFWMQNAFHWMRNDYDKIGHFAQGLVPAFVIRELLLRYFKLTSRSLVAVVTVASCLGISAFYELIEWWSALALGSGADEFLGTQGDPWDTQSDMFMALIGAITALLFARTHDRAMRSMED